MTVPDLSAANKVVATLRRLGVYDVEPMYDSQVQLWAVCQQFKPSGKILLLNSAESYEAKPILLWWCRTTDGQYREPNDQDVADIVVTVKRAQVIFDKGSDWLVDRLEDQEQAQYDKNRQAQSDKIRSIAPAMKKYIKRELL